MYSVLLASSLLILLKSAQCTNIDFLDTASDEIPAGNFSYFSFSHPGILSLILISNKGDCDLYVSQFERKPTFEHFAYCLQSSSCGVDTVIVPESFKRPFSIGIYGHPSHEVSECTLNIYKIDGAQGEDEGLDELYITSKYDGQKAFPKSPEEEEDSDYESLPIIMIVIYYLYSFIEYFLDLSMYTPFTPNEAIELVLELLFF